MAACGVWRLERTPNERSDQAQTRATAADNRYRAQKPDAQKEHVTNINKTYNGCQLPCRRQAAPKKTRVVLSSSSHGRCCYSLLELVCELAGADSRGKAGHIQSPASHGDVCVAAKTEMKEMVVAEMTLCEYKKVDAGRYPQQAK